MCACTCVTQACLVTSQPSQVVRLSHARPCRLGQESIHEGPIWLDPQNARLQGMRLKPTFMSQMMGRLAVDPSAQAWIAIIFIHCVLLHSSASGPDSKARAHGLTWSTSLPALACARSSLMNDDRRTLLQNLSPSVRWNGDGRGRSWRVHSAAACLLPALSAGQCARWVPFSAKFGRARLADGMRVCGVLGRLQAYSLCSGHHHMLACSGSPISACPCCHAIPQLAPSLRQQLGSTNMASG